MATLKLENGIYEGDVIPHGKGVIKFNDSEDYYEGDFANGKFHGSGKLHYDLLGCFEGTWKDGEFVRGKCVYYEDYVFTKNTQTGITYEGDFKDLLLHGNGKTTDLEGNVYEGFFSYGEPKGKGKLTRSDGKVFETMNGVIMYQHTDEDYELSGGDQRFGGINESDQ